MELEDFLNKYIIIELKDGVKEEGILVEIKDYDTEDGAYTSLILRDPDAKYKIVYLNEIETLGELL